MELRVVEVIERKRDGGKLTAEEIEALVLGYAKGEVPDYQMAAFCMAVVWRGMDTAGTAALAAAVVGFRQGLQPSPLRPRRDQPLPRGRGAQPALRLRAPPPALGAP